MSQTKRLCRRYLQQSFFFFLWKRDYYREERGYHLFKEAKHGTQRTFSPSSCFIATCPAPPRIATRVFHESSPRSSAHAVSNCRAASCNTPTHQHVEPSRRCSSIPSRCAAQPHPAALRCTRWLWVGGRGGTGKAPGLWFMQLWRGPKMSPYGYNVMMALPLPTEVLEHEIPQQTHRQPRFTI